MIGFTLSHYKITAELGRGGMGIVYRAQDTKLNREVALKVLPSAALATDDDRARFYREAQAAAALHHPNIATIFEIDEAVPSDAPHGTQPSPFIVMEYIEGETLEARIKKGPMKLEEAVRVATQVAEALKLAHTKAIVHRDIKAANVMLGAEGSAKVLDFGLAKTSQSTQLTRMGSTLGTAAYMSPEQAKGEEVDGRTDLWALGVTLYEMVSGNNPFGGDYEQAVVYSILNTDPEPLTALRTGVPMELERIVDKLLHKEADRRYQSATDLIADLKGVKVTSGSSAPRTTSVRSQPNFPVMKKQRRDPKWLAPLLLAVATLAIGWFVGKSTQEPAGVPLDLHLSIPPLEKYFNELNDPERRAVALSPDGKWFAFDGDEDGRIGLFVIDLSTGTGIRRLTSTYSRQPSFSPNGDWIAYATSTGIYRVAVSGGEPILITSRSADTNEVHWGFDNNIYFIPNFGTGVSRVSLDSPEEEVMFSPDPALGERGFTSATLLPGGKTILTGRYGEGGLEIVSVDIKSGERKVLERGMSPVYSKTGHVFFAQGPRLMKAKLESDGSLSTPILISDRMFTDNGTLSSQHAVSDNGSLVFVEGRNEWGRKLEFRMFDGTVEVLDVGNKSYSEAYLSPDGNKLGIISPASETEDHELYVYDLEQRDLRQLSRTKSWEGFPLWLNDSETLIYGSEENGQADIYEMSSLGVSTPVFVDSTQKYSRSVTSDGNVIFFHRPYGTQANDIFAYDRNAKKDFLVVGGEANQLDPSLSPDNRLMAYESNESGVSEIYVVDYPPTKARIKVSTDGGKRAQFARTGRTLYYSRGTDLLRVKLGENGQRVGNPEVVMTGVASFFSVLPDESGVLTLEAPELRTVRYISQPKAERN